MQRLSIRETGRPAPTPIASEWFIPQGVDSATVEPGSMATRKYDYGLLAGEA